MARMIALGAGSLAIVFFLFMFFYFKASELLLGLSIVLSITYLVVYLISYTKITNKSLYNLILINHILTGLLILYIAHAFVFRPEFTILMLVIYVAILSSLPTTRQIWIFFAIFFSLLVIVLLFSPVTFWPGTLILISFGYIFAISYVISLQKKLLTKRSKQNEEILKTLVNNTSDAIILVDFISKKIWDANERSITFFGMSDVNEIKGKGYYDLLFDKEFINTNRTEITNQIKMLGYYQSEVLLRRKDDTSFWGQILIAPFQAAKNKYYLIQIENIDTKKKYEDKVLSNKEKLEFILNNLEELIYLKAFGNGTERFEYISPYIGKLFGISEDEYLSDKLRTKINKIYHPDDIKKNDELKEKLFQTKAKVSVQYRIKPVGTDHYLNIMETVIPQLNGQGEIEHVIGIIRELKD